MTKNSDTHTEEMTKAIKHAGKYMQREQNKIMPPIEYCPECYSLKRYPNKACKNHDSYYRKADSWNSLGEINELIVDLSEAMVKRIANRYIQVQDTHEGKSHQRYWYLRAQEGIRKALKSYKKSLYCTYNK